MRVGAKLALAAAMLALSASAFAAKKVDLDYHVRFLPQSDQAEVRLTLADGAALRSLDFDPVSYTHLTLPTNREV